MKKDTAQETQEILKKLQKKYQSMGQDMFSYLDGLLYSNYLTYWDYIHLDTLLSLQNPRTDFADEKIFIIYHQITELYFKLILLEMEQLCEQFADDKKQWIMRMKRIINYFKNLAQSFDIMIDGMEPQQFLKFRMALLPASGFQSAQYRKIEIMSTNLGNLMKENQREEIKGDLATEYSHAYWKSGNIELKTGIKTLTLRMFEEKYDESFLKLARKYQDKNIWTLYQNAAPEIKDDPKLRQLMQEYDLYVNIHWRLSHYKSAVRYLDRDPNAIAATGGTNWQKYLPPSFQRVFFFPDLWDETQQKEWGKAWVMKIFEEKISAQWRGMGADDKPKK